MANNTDQVDISIKLGADIKGGVQTEQELERVRAKSKELGKDAEKSGKSAAVGMYNLSRSVGYVRKALTGFGVAGMFTALIAGVSKIAESFGAAEKKANDLKKAADAKDLEKSISGLADSYAKLNQQLETAAKREQDALEIIDMEVKARRELQEAKLSAAEEDEIAGVDENADDAEEQKKVIREKYASIRRTRAASDKVEDLVLQRQKYSKQAEADDAAAKAKEDEAAALDKKARSVQARADMEEGASMAPNEKDKVGFGGYVGGQIRDIFSGNWGNLTSFKTAEGDAERDKHKSNSEAYAKQAEDLRKQAEAAREEAKAKRDSADQNRRRMTAMNGSVEAAQIAQDTENVKSETAEADAAKSLQKKREEKSKEQAKVDDAKKAYELLQQQKAEVEAKIADRQSDKDAMGKYVADAEGDYETAKLSGNKRQQQSAYAKLQQVKSTAQDVAHEADKEINELNETLKNIVRVMQAARSELEKTKKQTLVQQAEAISGD